MLYYTLVIDLKIVAGMSGGVDSSVTAALLLEQGHTVTGLFLSTGYQSPDDAAQVCAELGIPFHITDIRDRLDEYVIAPFVGEYINGRTPNPCVACNPNVKFPALLEHADRLGFDAVCTGHYARTRKMSGYTALLRAESPNDQSYMLYRLGEDALSRLVLPLGDMENKREVRRIAETLKLKPASKPDSMEICFIPDNDYAAFIERRAEAPPPGDIVDEDGNLLGRHLGVHRHTLGQRRGLGVSSSGKIYVTGIDAPRARVVLGAPESLRVRELDLKDAHWIAPETGPARAVTAKLRHSKTEYPARVTRLPDGGARAEFESAVKRPAPGQSVVFYGGDYVLGGGICL